MTNKKIQLPKTSIASVTLGCDPEFFFKKGKLIIGSEKLLPKGGLILTNSGSQKEAKCIIDGVQAELNPRASTCREILASELTSCLRKVQEHVKKEDSGIELDFSRTIKMTKKSLGELDPNNQKFGCAPSFSAYKTEHKKITKVNPLKYLSRSAGGHIHIGLNTSPTVRDILAKTPEKIVHMLDILCGNTMVLVDRDPSNVKRRELYGRAGEYRLPEYGIEYRTLSNCWLTAYPLMSLAFGMARYAIDLMNSDDNALYYETFTKAVDLADIEKAINTNDYDLALSNFNKIKDLICQTTVEGNRFSLTSTNIKNFLYFVDKINTNGLTYWFPSDPIKHWVDRSDNRYYGIRDFLTNYVMADMKEKNVK
jgi:hypothetical protein